MSGRSPDPVRMLQAAARAAAAHLAHCDGRRVVVFGADGSKLVDVVVPPASACGEPAGPEPPPVVPGWSFTDRQALFDGTAVPVAASRLRLLRVLAEADGALTAKELTERAFDRQTAVENTRFHLRELRKELKSAFGSFEGELVEGDAEGYRLVLR